MWGWAFAYDSDIACDSFALLASSRTSWRNVRFQACEVSGSTTGKRSKAAKESAPLH